MILSTGRKIEIIHKNITGSTNLDAKMQAEKYEEGTLFTADVQTAGKGRLGRTFDSQKGGLYASLLLKPSFSAQNTLLITVAAATAAGLAIDYISGEKSEIKWVNDVFLNGKKVCGILTEGAFNSTQNAFLYAVLGFGVNLIKPQNGFPEELKNIAGSIFETGDFEQIKQEFLKVFLEKFFEFYVNLEKREYMKIYRQKSLLMGKTVSFVLNNRQYCAKVLGITDNAELTVLSEEGEINLSCGEAKIIL